MQLQQTAEYILAHAKTPPQVAITLGSGLGAVAEIMQIDAELPYAEIPGFVRATVPGHAGKLLLGSIHGVGCAVLSGRMHMYEGYTAAQAAYYVYALRKAGVSQLVLTNAAGAVNTAYRPGDIMMITDHINLRGITPIDVTATKAFGSGFIDMGSAYTAALQAVADGVAKAQNLPLHHGVYMLMAGPQFETPAEIRAIRLLGGDAVGMSTVPEVIAARHCGMQLLAFSCITNMAAGILQQPLSHAEVMETGAAMREKLIHFVRALVPAIAANR